MTKVENAGVMPDGQIGGSPVQSPLQKYSRSLLTQITCISMAVPSHTGAFRDRHGRWARDAVDAIATQRKDFARTNGADADGEVVWS